MNTRRMRGWLAGLALTLALGMTSGVLAWQLLPSARAGGTVTQTDSGEYWLVEREGKVCVYAGDALISNTGIPVRTLPELDRIALEQGIHAKGQQELAALLEDFGA